MKQIQWMRLRDLQRTETVLMFYSDCVIVSNLVIVLPYFMFLSLLLNENWHRLPTKVNVIQINWVGFKMFNQSTSVD